MKTTKTASKNKNQLTIVDCLAKVVTEVRDSGLEPQFWEECKKELTFLKKKLNMTDMQVVILAILVEEGEPMSWRSLAKFVGCERLKLMACTEEVDDLLSKRWLRQAEERTRQNNYVEAVTLTYGVVNELRHNRPYEPEKLDGLSLQEVVDKVEREANRLINKDCDFEDFEDFVYEICNLNDNLPLCRQALQYDSSNFGVSTFMLLVVNYAWYGDTEQNGLRIGTLFNLFPDSMKSRMTCNALQSGQHALFSNGGYVEHKCVDGIANVGVLVLTRKAITDLLKGYTPSMSQYVEQTEYKSNALKSYTTIKEKEMFYNDEEKNSINTIVSLLDGERFKEVQHRLEEQGYRKGFAFLFYGEPGTGKTETVLQIARRTGRDIMKVNIASMRDKFVGETEKNIQEVFDQYRYECRHCDVTPILFFNEADGIFGKRMENAERSTDKMENAMQNIILQEMENLEGILIATTNLTNNLDDAFDRRFLYKVYFHSPNVETKAKLWLSMLGDLLNEKEALMLSECFDFSGGQIENIARKCSLHYVLNGNQPSFVDIEAFCKAELIDNRLPDYVRVGFRA